MDTTAAPGLVPIYVRRARNGRLTGWIVQCETCTDVTPVLRSKSACIEQARMHGTRVHQRQCRIISPIR